MSKKNKYLVVTPYYQEEESFLSRCIDSVRSQTVQCDHMLVSDGFPSKYVDCQKVRHIKLDQNHNDFGNTPRGVGCLIGIAEGYDGIALLDADNWFEPAHLQACLHAASNVPGGVTKCDFVIAKRYLRRPDETIMPISEEAGLVDTSCFFFLPGSYDVLPVWASMPKAVSPICDRIIAHTLRKRGYKAAYVQVPTVNYHNLWASSYEFLNEPAPKDAKADADVRKAIEELCSSAPREIQIINRLVGSEFISPTKIAPSGDQKTSTSRNKLCPCGSGKKYKHCHGSVV